MTKDNELRLLTPSPDTLLTLSMEVGIVLTVFGPVVLLSLTARALKDGADGELLTFEFLFPPGTTEEDEEEDDGEEDVDATGV